MTIKTVPHTDEWQEDVSAQCIQTRPSVTRAYLQRLRAAEMAAWEPDWRRLLAITVRYPMIVR